MLLILKTRTGAWPNFAIKYFINSFYDTNGNLLSLAKLVYMLPEVLPLKSLLLFSNETATGLDHYQDSSHLSISRMSQKLPL